MKFGFKSTIPSLQDIKFEFQNTCLYGVILSFVINLIRQIENSKDADMSVLLGTSDEAHQKRQQWFKSEIYQNRMKFLVEFYDKLEFLDVENLN